VAGLPSSVVNVRLNVVLDPTTTLAESVAEEATTLLFEVGGPGNWVTLTTGPHAANIARLATMAQ
jgi:hypothetical protein